MSPTLETVILEGYGCLAGRIKQRFRKEDGVAVNTEGADSGWRLETQDSC